MASAKRKRQRTHRLIQESVGTLQRVDFGLHDLDEAAVRPDGTIAICIATPGWGTFGYYSAETLEAAADAGVFASGVHMYWDHPTVTERTDRPERSLRDLAAVTETAGRWDPNGFRGPGVYAQARVFEGYRDIVNELAAHIGVSMRAGAHVSLGEAEGRRGQLVDRIVEAYSIDFVTKAGRGGAVQAVLEAAGRTDLLAEAAAVGPWFESRIHLDFTTRADDMYGDGRITKAERIALSNGIGAALDAFAQTVEELAPQLLTRDLWEPPADVTESMEDHDMPITTEERAAIAAEAATAVITQLTEAGVITAPGSADTTIVDEATATATAATERAERAERALLLESARRHATANTKVQGLPAVARTAVVERIVNEATANDDGTLNTTALDEALVTAVDAEVAYLNEATGSPIRGVGGDSAGTTDVSEAVSGRLEQTFKRLGMSDDAAKVAVGGRL